MSDRDRRIRDEAYWIWVEAGRPHGDEEKHWLEAERRLSASEKPGEKRKASEAAKSPAKTPGKTPAKTLAKSPASSTPLKGAAVEVGLKAAPRTPAIGAGSKAAKPAAVAPRPSVGPAPKSAEGSPKRGKP